MKLLIRAAERDTYKFNSFFLDVDMILEDSHFLSVAILLAIISSLDKILRI